MPFPDQSSELKDTHIIFATSKGKIRKNSISDFEQINNAGKIAMKLDGDDKITGSNEDELKSKNIKYKVGKFPFSASGRALAVDQSVGFVKVLSDIITDTILGVHVFGPAAAEIVQQALISMEFGASSEDIALTMFSHPTVSEAFHEAALASNNQAIHIGNKIK